MKEDEEREHLEAQLASFRRTKHLLEEQAAQFGIALPPHIAHSLHETRHNIEQITRQLSQMLPVGATRVDFWTYDGGNPGGEDCEKIDWSESFREQYPSSNQWSIELLPQLRALLDRCSKKSSRAIALHPQAHISAAIAFGYTFPVTSPYHLWIDQKGAWWHTDEQAAEAAPLVEFEDEAAPDQLDTSVEVSVVWDISADVAATIVQQHLPIGHRARLKLSSPQRVRDAAHAQAIAEQVHATVVRVRERERRQTIHLFAAVPVALAALIGAQLNACGPIQCYEHRKGHGGYVPACLL